MLTRLIDWYCQAIRFGMVVALALMVVLVFGNVVLRYGFNTGITVSEELSRWLFVWVTFMGAIVAMKEGTHLGSDTLVSRLSLAGKKVCFVLAHLLMLFACLHPNRPMPFLFFFMPVTVKPKHLAWAMAGLSAIGLAVSEIPGDRFKLGIAHSAHLGGMAAALLYYYFVHLRE